MIHHILSKKLIGAALFITHLIIVCIAIEEVCLNDILATRKNQFLLLTYNIVNITIIYNILQYTG